MNHVKYEANYNVNESPATEKMGAKKSTPNWEKERKPIQIRTPEPSVSNMEKESTRHSLIFKAAGRKKTISIGANRKLRNTRGDTRVVLPLRALFPPPFAVFHF